MKELGQTLIFVFRVNYEQFRRGEWGRFETNSNIRDGNGGEGKNGGDDIWVKVREGVT
ncbi:MAG TPA: hypothetical protein VIM70_08140 [Clostridium sp.]|uniref:hypothetical protein n=1 Tax=Clostridium sp. TaxID=1506 RepID=UPI002F94B9D5